MILALILAAAPLSFPENLTRPVLARVERFQWPQPQAFHQGWARREAGGYQVYRGALRASDRSSRKGYFRVVEGRAETYLVALALDEPQQRHTAREWLLPKSFDPEAAVWPLADGLSFELEERLPNALGDADLIAWTYVSTLVGPREADQPEPVYGARDEVLDPLLSTLRDEKKLAAWVKANQKDDALYARVLAYQPMGSCSMDSRPAHAARLKAELAWARGDLANFLKRQVNIMGDQFARVAWSSWGEASHQTQASRLLSTGIDFDRFMVGLLVTRPGSAVALDPWRWARSAVEAGRKDSLRALARRIAEAPDSDPMNRLRAAQAFTWLELAGQPAVRGEEHRRALEQTGRLSLHPLAAAWVHQALSEPD